MERRVEQPDRHRQAVHRLEDLGEVLALERQQRGEGRLHAGLVLGHDELLDQLASLAEEHVLGAAQADALGAEPPGAGGVLGGVGVGAHPQPAGTVGVRHDPGDRVGEVVVELLALEVAYDDRVGDRHGAGEHLAGGAVDRDDVALARRSRRRARVNCLPLVSTSSDSAPHTQVRPMPRATTAAWEVLPPRLVRMPRAATMPRRSSGLVSLRTRITSSPRLGPLHGGVGVEDRLADRGTGRGVHALREERALGGLVEAREHQLGELLAGDAEDRLVHLDQALVDHVHGDAERRLGRALADAGLEHPELAALDGELDVAHVAVVALEPRHDAASGRRATCGRSRPCRRGRRCCGCRRRRPRPGRSGGSRRTRPGRRWPGRG